MDLRTAAVLIVGLAMTIGTAMAQDERLMPAPPGAKAPASGGLFQGTPEEHAACQSDATKFCLDDMPDTFRVLACLQEHRTKLRKVCQKVLESHGQ